MGVANNEVRLDMAVGINKYSSHEKFVQIIISKLY